MPMSKIRSTNLTFVVRKPMGAPHREPWLFRCRAMDAFGLPEGRRRHLLGMSDPRDGTGSPHFLHAPRLAVTVPFPSASPYPYPSPSIPAIHGPRTGGPTKRRR